MDPPKCIQDYTSQYGSLEPTIILDDSLKPKFTLEDDEDPMAPLLIECHRVRLPHISSGPTTEELRRNPTVIAMQEAVQNGAELEVRYKHPSDNFPTI